MISQSGTVRLLPWSSPEGAPCYLLGGGAGYISRMADNVESAQLDMAAELLDHAADMLADDEVTADQHRFLAARMAESLRDVHRIAESRGARLPEPDIEDPDDAEDPGEPEDTEAADESAQLLSEV